MAHQTVHLQAMDLDQVNREVVSKLYVWRCQVMYCNYSDWHYLYAARYSYSFVQIYLQYT